MYFGIHSQEAGTRIPRKLRLSSLSKVIVPESGEAVLGPDLYDSRASILDHYTIALDIHKPGNDMTQCGQITKTSNSKTEDYTTLLFCMDTSIFSESTRD